MKRKITSIKLLGIPSVLGLFLISLAALLRYLPTWVFWPATGAEIILGPYLIRKIHALRRSA